MGKVDPWGRGGGVEGWKYNQFSTKNLQGHLFRKIVKLFKIQCQLFLFPKPIYKYTWAGAVQGV